MDLIEQLKQYVDSYLYDDSAYSDAVGAAKKIVQHKDKDAYCVLDTETSGLTDDDEIIQIAITDLDGNCLLNQLINPTCDIYPEAEAVHGISLDLLEDAPTFKEVYPDILEAIKGKQICIYNKQFDISKLAHCIDLYELDNYGFYECSICIMEMYAAYVNEWDDYWGNWKWQPLNGDHSALGDCRATAELIKKMADSRYREPPEAYYLLKQKGEKSNLLSIVESAFPQLT